MKTTAVAAAFAFVTCAQILHALPLLSSPKLQDLRGPAFVQPFASVTVDSVTGGVGTTTPFFSDLPDNSFPNNVAVNILGNFRTFDSSGVPAPLNIVGVRVTTGGGTITPAFGRLNFDGASSATFSDSLDGDAVTFSAADLTLAFTFQGDPSLEYSYSLLVAGLDAGSTIVYDDVEETSVPEPCTLLPAVTVLAAFRALRNRYANRLDARM